MMKRIYDRTQTGSLEDRVNQLQSRAFRAGMEYMRRGQHTTSINGEQNQRMYHRALALAEALEVMTGGEVTVDEFAQGVRKEWEAEVARQAREAGV